MSASADPIYRPTLTRSSRTRVALGPLRDVASTVLRHVWPTARPKRHAFHYENVLGTSLELQMVAMNRDAARRAESLVLTEIDRLERLLSGYSKTSELSAWLATSGVDVPVSEELAHVLESAEQWRILTKGAFDPAAVSLVELLSDSAAAPTATVPDDETRRRALAARRDQLNQPLWEVTRARGTARRLTRLAVSLDALAKGYIVDRAAERARAVEGVSQVLVNIGGDLRHHGARSITATITDPNAPSDNAPPLAVVRLRDEALATSGGYRRGFVANGRRVSHILDPRAGQSAERVASASVIAPDCAAADALSTAFSVMETHESIALADSLPGVGCLIVESDGTVTSSSLWNTRATTSRHETTHLEKLT